jgi:hypothetical protein
MSASNYLELEILDHIFDIGAYTAPTVYLALCTADPTDAGTGAAMNEVADSGSYARVDASGNFGTAAAAGAISNDAAIEFPAATGSWGTVTHFAIVDSGTHGAGNLLFSGALTASKAITSGDTPQFAIGELTISAS